MINVKLANNKKDFLKCIAKLSYISHEKFDKNLVAICKRKVALKLNKPGYIGMCILELSKELLHEFHYDYIKKSWQQMENIIHRP